MELLARIDREAVEDQAGDHQLIVVIAQRQQLAVIPQRKGSGCVSGRHRSHLDRGVTAVLHQHLQADIEFELALDLIEQRILLVQIDSHVIPL